MLISVAGWMNHQQQDAIDYLREENRVLRELIGERRMRLNHDQRRRLAAKAKGIGRRILGRLATIVTPETLLVSHRRLIAEKYEWQLEPQSRAAPNSRQDRGVGW